MINAILRGGRFAVCLFACCLVSVAFGKVFDPRDFGAVGNGTNDDTRAIRGGKDGASDTVWLERDGGISVFRTLPGTAFVRARWIDPD